MNTKTAEWGRWTSHCGIIFRTRKELFAHNKVCSECIEFLSKKQKRAAETRQKNWTPENSRRVSEAQKIAQSRPEVIKKHSEATVFNNFWKYRSKNPILYESKIAGKIKLDSTWELEVAKRLDSLGVEWYRPRVRIPYLDSKGVEHGYFPDFYVKDYNCFIEVKSPFIAKYQNSDHKVEYLKSHYNFIKWIESEDACKTFELEDLHYNSSPEKDEEDINYWINIKKQKQKEKSHKYNFGKKRIEKETSQKAILRKTRWEIIQNSGIDFTKFGWVSQIAKLFGIAGNKAGAYIKNNYPEFYKTCYVRKPISC